MVHLPVPGTIWGCKVNGGARQSDLEAFDRDGAHG